MSDVADMLGLTTTKQVNNNNSNNVVTDILTSSQPLTTSTTATAATLANSNKKKKPKGMKREVFDLLGPDGLLPATQLPQVLPPTFKNKRITILKGKWSYEVIHNSARKDSNNVSFYHWVKTEMNCFDYPYAKFNLHLDRPYYTEEEYHQYLEDQTWTKEETEELIDLCIQYDLRWPVIYDQYPSNMTTSQRSIEELMARYYFIAQRYNNPYASFDLEKEKKRRFIQDQLFKRTREDEIEEMAIKEELKSIEAMIKKSKKQVKSTPTASSSSVVTPHVASGGDWHSYSAALTDSRGLLTATTTSPVAELYQGPQPGRPCLQSSRLYLTSNLNLSKSLIGKMNSYLKEIGMPERPLATKTVCDLIDGIRKDTVALMSLTSLTVKKEKDLGSAKTNSAKSTAKASQKSSKAKASKPKTPANNTNAGADAADSAAGNAKGNSDNAKAVPNDSNLVGLLDVFDSNVPLEVEVKPAKPAPKKRSRAKKDTNAAAAAAAAAASAATVSTEPLPLGGIEHVPTVDTANLEAKFDLDASGAMSVFDDISVLDDFDLSPAQPTPKKSRR
eukprot:gene3922-4288_t